MYDVTESLSADQLFSNIAGSLSNDAQDDVD